MESEYWPFCCLSATVHVTSKATSSLKESSFSSFWLFLIYLAKLPWSSCDCSKNKQTNKQLYSWWVAEKRISESMRILNKELWWTVHSQLHNKATLSINEGKLKYQISLLFNQHPSENLQYLSFDLSTSLIFLATSLPCLSCLPFYILISFDFFFCFSLLPCPLSLPQFIYFFPFSLPVLLSLSPLSSLNTDGIK